MSQPLLSILIVTIPGRETMFAALIKELVRQREFTNKKAFSYLYRRCGKIDLTEIIHYFNEEDTVGQARNILLDRATGKFVVYIDDDDHISENYLVEILSAITLHSDIDCIGMRGHITTNGEDKRDWVISKDCLKWHEQGRTYMRTPNHISPVRAEVAKKIKFPDIDHGEDYEYSVGILPYLKKEHFIDKQLYHYDYRSK